MSSRGTMSLRQALRESVIEGACYALMVGFGELFFIADAVRLGAGDLALGLVVGLPLFVGAIGALLSTKLSRRIGSAKSAALVGASGQALVLAGVVVAELIGLSSPELLIAFVCIYQLFGQVTGVHWASWFGGLVPSRVRGPYFAGRNRIVHGVTLASVLAAGLLLHAIEDKAAADTAVQSFSLGFVILFSIAAASRLLSVSLLWRAPEVRIGSKDNPALARAKTPIHASAKQVIATAGLLYFTVYIASPYFGPHMLKTLRWDYAEYTTASVAAVLARVALLPAWGKLLQHYAARSVFLLSVLGIAILPIPWILTDSLIVLCAAQMLSGAAWGGHEVSQFSMVLEKVSDSRARTAAFAAIGATVGSAQLLGTLAGGVLLGQFDFTVVAATSTVLRFVVVAMSPAWIQGGDGRAAEAPRRVVLMRLAGLRASGGLAHRPIPGEE